MDSDNLSCLQAAYKLRCAAAAPVANEYETHANVAVPAAIAASAVTGRSQTLPSSVVTLFPRPAAPCPPAVLPDSFTVAGSTSGLGFAAVGGSQVTLWTSRKKNKYCWTHTMTIIHRVGSLSEPHTNQKLTSSQIKATKFSRARAPMHGGATAQQECCRLEVPRK